MSVRLALLFDFDGTLYVGDLPTLAYARHCADQLPVDAATELIDGIRFFLEGTSILDRRVDLAAAVDGEQAVDILAAAAGLTPEQTATAYRRARADLAGSAFALEAPDGLADLLNELADVHIAIVTDAHPVGVAEVLAAIGLTRYVDEVVTDAGKPDSMPAILERTLAHIDALAEPGRLMVIGDRWFDDLADACRIGATTALIDRFGRGDGQPTERATDLAALIPAIRGWALRFGSTTGEP